MSMSAYAPRIDWRRYRSIHASLSDGHMYLPMDYTLTEYDSDVPELRCTATESYGMDNANWVAYLTGVTPILLLGGDYGLVRLTRRHCQCFGTCLISCFEVLLRCQFKG